MKRFIEDTIITWLRSQPAFANRSRFDLELLIGDLVRNIDDEIDDYMAHVEAEADAKREAEDREIAEVWKTITTKKAGAKQTKRKSVAAA